MSGVLRVPDGLTWLHGMPGGSEWLAGLPGRLATCARRWSLRLGPPFGYACASLAVPAELPDGTRAVLKVQFPDAESAHEATALRRWDGAGAVRLLAHDAGLRALLLERCDPGTPLHAVPLDEALDAVVALLPRLWVPAGQPFLSLAEAATGWAARLPVKWERAGRPFERRLVDAALDLLGGLTGSQGAQVLVNQDLHAGNVLRAEREPWLVIDPKPLVGEREFSVVAMVRGTELGHSRVAVRRRLDRLSAELGLDRDRVRGWTIGQTMAWSIDGDRVFTDHADVVRWLLD
ncbi:aminoglycoside phosphotransferase family protein [Verrucosispora sp. WMMC514]|uniref:aminoglycoside phosphotransferase family protein n=1 Tax=Verrucosispora sp. WMMC514 TaxID=3015156 RepID=UPI00248BE45C|nr:aminoglycoside phosphotransferase family protein [Verrucosispora sp. WMMC514]WBB92541.1 aminoglycoside phosphotransferase [Verrucosispora sp. WMMC514]